jgi:glycosyltransferase involved in cell wall biosynthesis
MERTTLIIPCYNEASRLDRAAFSTFLVDPHVDLIFVDDGSTDRTADVLAQFAAEHPKRIDVLALERNQGKAEAVRRGLIAAIADGRSGIVGYLDADLATTPAEMRRLIQVLAGSDAKVLLGARVAILGRRIERNPVRHYLGRLFATAASLALRVPAYDTQCGAKLFRVTPALADALDAPFLSRWAFDVELIGRLLIGSPAAPSLVATDFWEEPLRAWRDVKGSKLAPLQMAKTLLELVRIDADLARRRSRMSGAPRDAGIASIRSQAQYVAR